jgi:hypothetical protein
MYIYSAYAIMWGRKDTYIHTYIHVPYNLSFNMMQRPLYNMVERTVLAPNTSTFLQTLAAEAHLAGGQFLLEEQTLNKAKY